MGFELDTSGAVNMRGRWDHAWKHFMEWSDLSPFAQGYIREALTTAPHLRFVQKADGTPGFRHLAPVTLAAMLKDCDVACGIYFSLPRNEEAQRNYGAMFWSDRQHRSFLTSASRERFPSLTLYLANDGLIYRRAEK